MSDRIGVDMLLGFKFANFGAFRDEQVFDMRPTYTQPALWDGAHLGVSAVAALFGANASGKSTFVDALRFVQTAVTRSFADWKDIPVPRRPFVLDDESRGKPSTFELEFVADDGLTYRYGFAVDDARVIEEHLFRYRTARRTKLFVRDEYSTSPAWQFGKQLGGGATQLRAITRSNSLFLSAAAVSENADLQPVYRWFERLWVLDSSGWPTEHQVVAKAITKDPSRGRWIKHFLRGADLGVSGLGVERAQVPPEVEADIRKHMPEPLIDQLLETLSTQLVLEHGAARGAVRLRPEEESQGTKAAVSFASLAKTALDEGLVVVIDELDGSLHPLLVRELIRIFAEPLLNPRHAQLIFTTHDATLLPGLLDPVLERDQIWLTEKDRDGSSTLVALTDYGPRKDENLLRRYLTGRFGGVPQPSVRDALLAELQDA